MAEAVAHSKPKFQSTLPAWGETQRVVGFLFPRLISIHSPRMGREPEASTPTASQIISIHSPRMGRDQRLRGFALTPEDFNPLSPHGERRGNHGHFPSQRNFNPLSPHGERLQGGPLMHVIAAISIHSPRMGRDGSDAQIGRERAHFNPLSPHGERRGGMITLSWVESISIHSPRMGRDHLPELGLGMGRAISIHSPRMGRDGRTLRGQHSRPHFNPLSPHGERPGAQR